MVDGLQQYISYFRFLRFSLGLEAVPPVITDWRAMYHFAENQTVGAVIFDGIQRLPDEAMPPMKIRQKWLKKCVQIIRRNSLLNDITVEVYSLITAAGYPCVIQKGQGNARRYPNPLARTPGDVDVWVKAPREELRSLARRLAADDGGRINESINHIELHYRGNIVELHITPGFMANAVYHRRLQRWFDRNMDRQCANMVTLPGMKSQIAVPTREFDLVYQLYHLFHHYFYEGVGLRQIVDYYYLLSDGERVEKEDFRAQLQYLGLGKFAGAVMYVLHVVMGLPEEAMPIAMDARRGRLFLSDILTGGNFGRHDSSGGDGQKPAECGTIGHNLNRLARDARLMRYYPAEALSEPLFRLWHWWWRKSIG